MVGWCDGAGLTSCAGAVLLVWVRVRQGSTVLSTGAGGVIWTFFLSSVISVFFLPLFGRRPDIGSIVSKGHLAEEEPTNQHYNKWQMS